MNGYLCLSWVSLAERLRAIFCCTLALEPPRPCKLILVKDFIVANRCVEFGLARWYLSPVGAIRNFIQLCEWGFTFETLPFVMGFYSVLLCLNDCLYSAITCFNFLNLLCFGLMDPLQWYHIRFSSS